MKKIIWLTFLVVMMTGFKTGAQQHDSLAGFNPRFEIFTLPGGFPANSVQGIAQDSIGFLWFASQAGLIRFDGKNFLTYRYDQNNVNTPGGDYIEYIFLDSKGLIWMTHWQQGGLTCFDPEREIFTHYKNDPDDPESLNGSQLSVVGEDSSGYIWIGGQEGLDRLNPVTGKVRHFHHDPENPQSLSCDQVRAIYLDQEGTLWVGTGFPWDGYGTDTGGLNRYDPDTETFTRYMHDPDDPNSIANNKVRAILEDSKGNFWIGTAGDGLQRMDRSTGKFERLAYDPVNPGKLSRPFLRGSGPAEVQANSHVTCIFEDHEKRIWITAIEGGLNVYDPASHTMRHFEKETGKDELNSNFLWQVNQTRDGTIWIATGGEGNTVYKVSSGKELFPFFETRHRAEDTASLVHGIIKDRAGNIWLAQEYPPLLKQVDPRTGEEKIFTLDDQKDNGFWIASLALDREGKLWIGTSRGQYSGDPADGDFKLMRPAKMTPEIYGTFLAPLVITHDGLYWFASFDHGLFQFDMKTGDFVNYKHDPDDPNSLGGNRLWGLYEDTEGNLWAGGGSPYGEPDKPLFLDRFNPKTGTFEHFVVGKKIFGFAGGITEDLAGNIWFTDNAGSLYKLNPLTGELKEISQYNSLLPYGPILSVLQSRDGKIWLSFDNYLVAFDPLTETMTIFNDFLGVRAAPGGYWNGAGITDDGELLFARKNGYHAFYPDQVFQHHPDRKPDIRITGFRLLDEHIISGATDNSQGILKKPIWKTESIRLAHDQNVFSFSVACFDFYNSSDSQLQFMLDGYDRGWRKDLRDGETPSYINIPPGDYTFRVRGASSLGNWNEETISLDIIVLPPWWKAWWAYMIYGLIVIAAVIAIDRIQRRRLQERGRRKAREKELKHAREIEKAYNQLKTTQSQLIQAEKMASLGELTAGIAHEIQNPLNFVNNFSEVNQELLHELMEQIVNGQLQEAKLLADDISMNEQKINFHGKRADAIVKGMLQHSRTSTGQKTPTDINALADEYLRLSYHGLRAKNKSFNADFKLEADENLPKINVIPQDIGRVLLNLVNNAFYAVSKRDLTGDLTGPLYKPTVEICTKKLNNIVEIRVKDNGDGIPDEILKKIFQPFFTTKPTGEGTGLGLSMSYEIITKGHGGTLVVKTKEGEGTEFIIQLPL